MKFSLDDTLESGSIDLIFCFAFILCVIPITTFNVSLWMILDVYVVQDSKHVSFLMERKACILLFCS